MSKGSEQRPGDRKAYERNWDAIFGADKRKKKKLKNNLHVMLYY